uniref:Vignain n=1 Tax=Aegilops tauschii TaxID=37682 RepID=M8BNL6_AEGTA
MAARHEQWMGKYGRVYSDAPEKARRLEVFKANVAFIESTNAGNSKFWLEANQFADITEDEFRAIHTGYKPAAAADKGRSTGFRYANASLDDLPASVDWRTNGAVTPVKDQGQCGCCWAFSTVASMEGIVKLSTGKLVSLSEQELVDCDGTDKGCEGGLMDNAFEFVVKNRGLATEADYPYTGADGSTCDSSTAAATITGHEDVPANGEASLLKAVAAQPVSLAVDGGDNLFRFYKEACSPARAARSSTTASRPSANTTWEKPPAGWAKLNVDGSYVHGENTGGADMVWAPLGKKHDIERMKEAMELIKTTMMKARHGTMAAP